MRSSRVLALSKERDESKWQEYANELKTTSITRRMDHIEETYGVKAAQKAFRLHVRRYDPRVGPLNYSVIHNRVNLLKLIIESGKI